MSDWCQLHDFVEFLPVWVRDRDFSARASGRGNSDPPRVRSALADSRVTVKGFGLVFLVWKTCFRWLSSPQLFDAKFLLLSLICCLSTWGTQRKSAWVSWVWHPGRAQSQNPEGMHSKSFLCTVPKSLISKKINLKQTLQRPWSSKFFWKRSLLQAVKCFEILVTWRVLTIDSSNPNLDLITRWMMIFITHCMWQCDCWFFFSLVIFIFLFSHAFFK